MTDQQERLEIKQWIVGFTDGEGCFSVSMFRNKTTALGWQVFPEFVITQGEKSLPALKIFERYFGCGKIFINKRYDNHSEYLYRYCVRSIKDLHECIIPFFKKYQLRTAKQKDFKIFAGIIDMIIQKKHLSKFGLKIIAKKIEKMNRKKKSLFLESSETIRRAPAKTG
ncbi:MAG: LAGLIDADG family homing endonuclease [Candidatus Lloydbacteria bacterium]|nr:LAGLIDADG family homing endonuclease [Candidatus Lloydbacteria bacterium]